MNLRAWWKPTTAGRQNKQTKKQKLPEGKGRQEYVGDPAFYGEAGTTLKATFPRSRFTYPPKTEAKSIHQRMFPSLLPTIMLASVL